MTVLTTRMVKAVNERLQRIEGLKLKDRIVVEIFVQQDTLALDLLLVNLVGVAVCCHERSLSPVNHKSILAFVLNTANNI